ncbi:serine protease 3-like [Tribolium madens]|uniref:serine protease 3-like n=1 Tax=Tribolium madens TaxID=41895 RepID=UPI001CF75276|nr:serine protease 3-like [Tribolium madens]
MLLLVTFSTFLSYCLAATIQWNELWFLVSLSYQNHRNFCSGTLVLNERTVLTAASCMTRLENNIQYKDIEVHVNGFPPTYTVRNFKVHPEFDVSKPGINDLALLYLKQPTIFNIIFSIFTFTFTKPLQSSSVSKNADVVAYELNADKRTAHDRELKVVGSEADFCASTESVICATDKKTGSYCGKNFGGPLIDKKCGYIVGIIPYNPKTNCSSGHAEPFVRLSSYKEWINEELAFLPWFNSPQDTFHF